ncbi:ketosynthase chain-length factor [Streptomyces radicis]|uniref:Ketosynthase chain-length factor n=1 Tax=Streptomyces radicis TaxID=1750517 RepID=A0A3A9WGV7_9ACTN|nr:ketosynthase chain-length factor [Streptomyces radicis]RKN11543.1 ketosynthase chain-length factor [Streptomyces radicis]RKN26439.1 ketosynthase chain-length factor [Streptomyces radicis]
MRAAANAPPNAPAKAPAVLVTGCGVAAPNGLGTDAYWAATLAGRSGIGPVTLFDARGYPSRLAGEIQDFAPRDHLPVRLIPQTDRMTQLALATAEFAFDDAGVRPSDAGDYGAGVVTAATAGGYAFGERELRNLWSEGPDHVSAYQSFAWFYAVNTGQISIRHGIRGASGALVTEGAGGLDALGQARRLIRGGQPLMLAGGVDSSLCSWGWVGHLSSGRISGSAAHDRAYLPFDRAADGHVPGEGGALLVLEDADAARRRGARALGAIAGYAATFDPPPDSGRPGNLARAIRAALADAGVGPGDIGVVIADAAAVPDLDRAEADAVTAVFGPGGVPVTAPKTMTGRLGAGGGALDVVTALLALRDGVIPPTVHSVPDPAHGLDLVTVARRAPLTAALVLARGSGGFNSAVVVTAPTR